jgi:hypothetical protein
MFSAWKAKISTSVASSASTVTGWNRGQEAGLEPLRALPQRSAPAG